MSASGQTDILAVLPRGRHAAPRAVVRETQRARMLEAMVQAVAEKGYAHVAVADVIERAGVSRKTYYEQFANKEGCFLAAYDAGVDALLHAIDDGMADLAPDWRAAARRAHRRPALLTRPPGPSQREISAITVCPPRSLTDSSSPARRIRHRARSAAGMTEISRLRGCGRAGVRVGGAGVRVGGAGVRM